MGHREAGAVPVAVGPEEFVHLVVVVMVVVMIVVVVVVVVVVVMK